MDNRGVHAVVRRPGGALAYAVYAVGTTRALTDSTFPTDHSALLGYSNGQAIQLATAAEVSPNTLMSEKQVLAKVKIQTESMNSVFHYKHL